MLKSMGELELASSDSKIRNILLGNLGPSTDGRNIYPIRAKVIVRQP
jgi:hypothetical protein